MGTRFKTLDFWLLLLPIALMGIGSAVIYVLTYEQGSALIIRQLISVVLAIVLLLAIPFVDYRALKAWSGWFYAFGLIALALVPLIGKEEFGAKLWIDIGPIQFQPGEIMKVIMALALASVLGATAATLSARRFFAAALMLIIPSAAILLQPDLGTTLVVAGSGIVIILHARLARWQRWLSITTLVVIGVVFGLAIANVGPFGTLLKPYQRDRLTSFINPESDLSRSGYNVAQSVIAVGSGGLSGKGLGFGSQSQLNFVPVAHADFIFAATAESFGWVGSVSVIMLLILLITRCIQAARIAGDDVGTLFCLAIAAKLLIEVLVNIGMNIGVMPVTGIPLPFMSYGGTAMITNALCIGIVQSVVLRYKRLTF